MLSLLDVVVGAAAVAVNLQIQMLLKRAHKNDARTSMYLKYNNEDGTWISKNSS